MEFLSSGKPDSFAALTAWSLQAIVIAGVLAFLVRLVQVRTQFRKVVKQNDIPILPHSFLFGHLVSVGKALASYPGDYGRLNISTILERAYPEVTAPGLFYLDTWPFGTLMIFVTHPELAAQFTQDKSLRKAAMVNRELNPLTEGHNLVTMEDTEWKTWRSVFNPGFSNRNVTALLPAFLEEIQVLKGALFKAAASGEIIKMEETARKLTVDIICRAVLGIRLHSQTRPIDFINVLNNQVWWLTCDYSIPNRLKELFPLRPLILWNNNRKMKNFLAPLVEQGVAKVDSDDISNIKTINSLAAQAYISEVRPQILMAGKANSIDSVYLNTAIAQLKIFIFAGHDTTASTLSFAYSRLYRDAAVLTKVRAEHDEVLGPDPSQAAARLAENPSLLNALPYTQAIVKETLRLYPPAGSLRTGVAGFVLTHPDTGKVYPTEGFDIFSASVAIHRRADYWERADEFVPERWLIKEGSEGLQARKNAWRPFELGPRNCIGQELALLELRAILAMTLRELDFEPAYPADAIEVNGEKAYQVMDVGHITGHIKDGFPVRVKVRG